MSKLELKIGQVLYAHERYTRRKGMEAYVEIHVVGETSRSWLVMQHKSWNLDRATKIPKNGNLQELGYLTSLEEVAKTVWAAENRYKIGREMESICCRASHDELKHIVQFMEQFKKKE